MCINFLSSFGYILWGIINSLFVAIQNWIRNIEDLNVFFYYIKHMIYVNPSIRYRNVSGKIVSFTFFQIIDWYESWFFTSKTILTFCSLCRHFDCFSYTLLGFTRTNLKRRPHLTKIDLWVFPLLTTISSLI